MIFSLPTFTVIHVVLSLVALVSGLVVAGGMIAGKDSGRWTPVFLATIVLTNVTGYGFPFVTLLPGHIIGALSLVILAFVIVARYRKHLAGPWRNVYVIGSVTTMYFNVFILVVQLFKRTPGLIAAAPTQKEPIFALTQLLVLALFVWLGRAAVKGFRAESAMADTRSPAMAR
jgi:hypothetical protein